MVTLNKKLFKQYLNHLLFGDQPVNKMPQFGQKMQRSFALPGAKILARYHASTEIFTGLAMQR
jgi:hypothetical protein